MKIPRNSKIIKIDQQERDSIRSRLLNKYSLPDQIFVGSIVNYQYFYNNIKVSGKGKLISKENRPIGLKLTLLTEDKTQLKFLYNPEYINLSLIKNPIKKPKKAKLKYLIEKSNK